jgi:hypothetical protein
MEGVFEQFSRSGVCEDPGQARAPLFYFIPFSRVIIDPLHAFLRIGGKLLSLALKEVSPSSLYLLSRLLFLTLH